MGHRFAFALTSVGFGIAALAFAGINIMPYGWRGLYALALIPLVLIIPLRQVLPESRRFEREQSEGISPRNIMVPVKALFSAYPGRLIMLMSVAFLGNLGGNPQGFFFPSICRKRMDGRPAMFRACTLWAAHSESWATLFPAGSAIASDVAGWEHFSTSCADVRVLALFVVQLDQNRAAADPSLFSAVIPIWIFQLFFDVASSTIAVAYSAELFPTSYRSTAGSVLAVTGTTGGALGFFLEASSIARPGPTGSRFNISPSSG